MNTTNFIIIIIINIIIISYTVVVEEKKRDVFYFPFVRIVWVVYKKLMFCLNIKDIIATISYQI
jgi:hypothetical protein